MEASRGLGRMQEQALLRGDNSAMSGGGGGSSRMEFPTMSSAFPETSKFYHRAIQEEQKGGVIREITQENQSVSEEDGDETDNLNQITFMQSAGQASVRKMQPSDTGDTFDGYEKKSSKTQMTKDPLLIVAEQSQDTAQIARGSQILRQDMLQSADKLLKKKNQPSSKSGDGNTTFSSEQFQSSEFNSNSQQSNKNESRTSSQRRINQKSKMLTDYTLLMLNFIPATIIQQLVMSDTAASSVAQSQQLSSEKKTPTTSHKSLPSTSDREQSLQIPLRCNVNSVVLVAEFINFYNQEKQLEYNNIKNYNEYLVTQSSTFLEIVSSCLSKFGGDLIQFMGYSFVACWPRPTQLESASDEEGPGRVRRQQEAEFIRQISRKAAQCALEAKREILKVLGAKVKVIFGLCHGDFQILHMGGILKRIEFFASGYAYQRALSAMRSIRKLKDDRAGAADIKSIAITPETWAYLRDFSTTDFYVDHSGSQQVKMKSTATKILDPANQQQHSGQNANVKFFKSEYLQKERIDEKEIQRVQVQIKSYIPAALRHFAHIKEDRLLYAQGSHLKQTVVAIAIELNQESLDCTTKHQLNLLQSFVEIVQMQVYIMEGSINRILSYEGGLIVLASWGTPTLSHHDDAPRAIYAALNIKKELIRFQQDFMVEDDTFVEPPIHIGIATGDIYSGIVGRNQRKEIVSIGPAIERSFLLMQTALKHYGKVYVDQQTKMSAAHFIKFEFAEMLEFSHKVINETIYMVVDEEAQRGLQPPGVTRQIQKSKQDEQRSLDKKARLRAQAQKIMIHANPFFLDRDNSYQRKFSETYGRSEIIHNICDDIAEYIDKQEDKNVWVIAIRGSAGSGKSLFARRLLIETSYRENTLLRPLQQKYSNSFHFEYVVCNCNSNVEKKFIGTWRPFLRHLLTIYSDHLRQSKEYTINSQIQFSNVEDKVDVIEAIFDLKNLARSKSQASFGITKNSSNLTLNSVNAFTNGKHRTRQRQIAGQISLAGERYEPDFEDAVILFCLDFILQALEALQPICCFFVIFDSVSMMNVTSWKLFDLVSAQPNLLVMVMCIQTVQKYFATAYQSTQVSNFQFLIAEGFRTEEARNYYQKYIKPREFEIFNIADMTPISKASFKKALIDLAPVYERDINITIEEMTKILDTTTSEKKFADQQKIANQLIINFQAHQHFKNISEDILDQIVGISQGNPLVAFWFTFQAMLGRFVRIKNFTLVPSQKFRSSMTLGDWVNLNLPWPLFKHNQMLIQNALTDSKFQQTTTSMMQMQYLLQTAAVIGDVFSMRMLDTVNKNFLKQESQQVLPTMTLLAELEQRDLIEFLYDDIMLNDKFYRFTHPFTRATIYQSLPWQWKAKEIHSKIIDFMKDRVIYDMTTGWSFSKEYMIMMRHVMNHEQVYKEARLSQRSKQLLIVKKINQQLAQNNKKRCILSGTTDVNFESRDSRNDRERVEKWTKLTVNLKMNCIQFFESSASSTEKFSATRVITRTAETLYNVAARNNDSNAGMSQNDLFNNNGGGVMAIDSSQNVCFGYVELDQITRVKEGQKKERRGEKDSKSNCLVIKCNKWHRIDRTVMRQGGNFTQHGKAEFVLTLSEVSHPAGKESKAPIFRDAIEWITAIEYLRAKSTFDSFVDNFGKVDFQAHQLGQQTTLMQRKEAQNATHSDNKFSLDFQGRFMQRHQALHLERYIDIANANLLADEGAKSNGAGSGQTGKFKRRQTLEAGELLRNATSKKVSADEMQARRVKDLSKKLLILYNVSSVSFYGHMQTCALKDPKVEEEDILGLGRFSAIDQTNIAQRSQRKTTLMRRQTMMGQNTQALNLQTQMQILIRRHIPKPLTFTMQSSADIAPLERNMTRIRSSRLQFTGGEMSGDDQSVGSSSMTDDRTDTGLTSPHNKGKDQETVQEYDAFADQNISHIYNTMSNFNAEKNLFTEERRAVMGRTRPGKFLPGQKVGVTKMYLQEKLDGELANFKLQKRHDRIGYNQAMTPFIAISSDDRLSACQSAHSSLHSTTPQLLATVKSNGSFKTYNSAQNKNSSSQKHLQQQLRGSGLPPPAGVTSILSQQNGAKLPQNTRKAKGIAIQKILESTQKPWFMLTGHEYHRPSPFGQKYDDQESDKAARITMMHSKQGSTDSFMEQQRRKQENAKNWGTETHQHHQANHSFNRDEEESKDGFKVSDKSKSSIRDFAVDANSSDDYKMREQSSKRSTPKSLTSLIKLETKRQSTSHQHTEQLTQSASDHNHKSTNDKPVTKISSQTPAMRKDKAAIILGDKTPFVVLRDEGRTQLTADQVDFELNANDVIFVERNLPDQQEGSGAAVQLSQGYCLVHNKPQTIILPRSAFKMLSSTPTQQQDRRDLNRITEETSDHSQGAKSTSQMLGVQPERKMVMEDSAERLLLKSPTELGIMPSYSSSRISHQQHLPPPSSPATMTPDPTYRATPTMMNQPQKLQFEEVRRIQQQQRPATTMASSALKVNQRKLKLAPQNQQLQQQLPVEKHHSAQKPSTSNQPPVLTKHERRRQQRELINNIFVHETEDDGPPEAYTLITPPRNNPSMSSSKGKGAPNGNGYRLATQADQQSTKPSGSDGGGTAMR